MHIYRIKKNIAILLYKQLKSIGSIYSDFYFRLMIKKKKTPQTKRIIMGCLLEGDNVSRYEESSYIIEYIAKVA